MRTTTAEVTPLARNLTAGRGARRRPASSWSPSRPTPYRRLGILPLVCATVTAGLALAGCALDDRDGGSLAGQLAADQAAALNERLGHRDRVRDAEHIAATEVLQEDESVSAGGAAVRFVPLAWSGRTTGSEEATIDVRIVATVDERSPVSFGERGTSAGQATRCYRYLLELYRYTSYREIDCPAVESPPVPSAGPVPKLPTDARERLTATLRDATPETLAQAVRTAFPEEHVIVDTVTHQGVLVAAVGVPAERECLLMVRTAGGAIESPGYDRVWLEPGEMGCETGLYVAPPR